MFLLCLPSGKLQHNTGWLLEVLFYFAITLRHVYMLRCTARTNDVILNPFIGLLPWSRSCNKKSVDFAFPGFILWEQSWPSVRTSSWSWLLR